MTDLQHFRNLKNCDVDELFSDRFLLESNLITKFETDQGMIVLYRHNDKKIEEIFYKGDIHKSLTLFRYCVGSWSGKFASNSRCLSKILELKCMDECWLSKVTQTKRMSYKRTKIYLKYHFHYFTSKKTSKNRLKCLNKIHSILVSCPTKIQLKYYKLLRLCDLQSFLDQSIRFSTLERRFYGRLSSHMSNLLKSYNIEVSRWLFKKSKTLVGQSVSWVIILINLVT